MDQHTGLVRALVGGRGEKKASLTLNRATDMLRQPGSTFKILTAYAPALDAVGETLATIYENTPFFYEDGTPVSKLGAVLIRAVRSRSGKQSPARSISPPRVASLPSPPHSDSSMHRTSVSRLCARLLTVSSRLHSAASPTV